MPRELITIQIGQCGNQIGTKFWERALQEHAQASSNGCFDEAMSSFFRNVDTRYDDPLELPVGDGSTKIRSLKARAVLVDMEEGVTSAVLRGPMGEIFDGRQFITDVSGSGNNWAQGHMEYGPQYHNELLEKIRRPVEFCDSLQSFFLMHSLGGGTGSGLGTYVLSTLADEYPDIYRFSTVVFPSEDDDVITSPYNSVLALNELTQYADCVLPLDNTSLAQTSSSVLAIPKATSGVGDGGAAPNPFDGMNDIAASLLCNLTSGMRFAGSLNVDLNEITMNLVPYPRLHYLVPSLAPLTKTAGDLKFRKVRMEEMFSDVMSPKNQLIQVDPRQHNYLAKALLVRGNVAVSDVQRNIERLKPQMKMIRWNEDGFKVGICSVPPVGMKHAILGLANNCGISSTFERMGERFMKLYKRKAHVHHYTRFMPGSEGQSVFDEAYESLRSITNEYQELDRVPSHQSANDDAGSRSHQSPHRIQIL